MQGDRAVIRFYNQVTRQLIVTISITTDGDMCQQTRPIMREDCVPVGFTVGRTATESGESVVRDERAIVSSQFAAVVEDCAAQSGAAAAISRVSIAAENSTCPAIVTAGTTPCPIPADPTVTSP